jgi:hypothetical protein
MQISGLELQLTEAEAKAEAAPSPQGPKGDVDLHQRLNSLSKLLAEANSTMAHQERQLWRYLPSLLMPASSSRTIFVIFNTLTMFEVTHQCALRLGSNINRISVRTSTRPPKKMHVMGITVINRRAIEVCPASQSPGP